MALRCFFWANLLNLPSFCSTSSTWTRFQNVFKGVGDSSPTSGEDSPLFFLETVFHPSLSSVVKISATLCGWSPSKVVQTRGGRGSWAIFDPLSLKTEFCRELGSPVSYLLGVVLLSTYHFSSSLLLKEFSVFKTPGVALLLNPKLLVGGPCRNKVP